jgi:hypothetical protein
MASLKKEKQALTIFFAFLQKGLFIWLVVKNLPPHGFFKGQESI